MSRSTKSIDEMIELAKEGKLSRRQFGQLLAATGVSLATVPAFSRSASADEDQAFYFTWGGYDIPELLGGYIEKHGTMPDTSPYAATEEALAKVRAGFPVDVLHPCNTNFPRWIHDGVCQPLDTSRLSNWNDMVPSLQKIGMMDGQHFFAAMDWGQTSVTYRTDLVDIDGEESWGILWDEKYKGRVAMIGNEGDAWWCAAIYAGVPFEEIHTKENIDKVAKLLRDQYQAGMVRMYTDDMTTVAQALASGELVAAMTWNETPVTLKKEGVPVKFADTKEGALTWVCGAILYSEAPHVDKAYDVIDSLLLPESGRFLIEDYGYGHSNKKSFDLVSEERLAELGLSRNPDDVLSKGHFQTETSEEFVATIAPLYDEIKAGF